MKACKQIRDFLVRPISYKVILILLAVILGLLLFPLFYVAKWNVPSADDYSNGIFLHDALMNGAGFFEMVRIVAERSLEVYNVWQGSMSGNVLCTLQPAAFGSQYYALVPYIMLISLIAGICAFVVRFFMLFSARKQYGFIISVVLLIGCTQFLPSPVQGIYWYTGAVYYTFLFSLSLILYTLMIRIAVKPDGDRAIGKQIAVCLLCVVIAFSNYTTALTTAVLLPSLICLLILMKKGTWKCFLIPLVLYAVSFYLNLSAPGNTAHIDAYVTDNGVVKSVTTSFAYAVTQIEDWNRLSVWALYLLLCPLLWKIASESAHDFRLPWLVSLYSFCLLASMNFPTFYAGAEISGRVENIRYFAMLILFVINIFYWFGWMSKKCFRYTGKNALRLNALWLAGTAVMFLTGLINIPSYRITTLSAVQSYYLGQIGQYKHVFNQRLEILEDPEVTDAVLREYPRKKPFILYFDDITQDPNDWRNVNMANFFHKDSVRLRSEEEK